MAVEDVTIDTPFQEIQFPPKLSFGSSGGPGFKTSAFEVDSGLLGGTIEWERLRARYDVVLNNVTTEDMENVQSHFYAMHGRGIGFRFKDWLDFAIQNQTFFVGDGTTIVFQIYKRYISGNKKYDRPIKKLVSGTLGNVTVDNVLQTEGVDYTVDYNQGTFTFSAAPVWGAVGRISYVEFDVPVRYDVDYLDIQTADFRQYTASAIPMVELLV